jgi:hypothetical protein
MQVRGTYRLYPTGTAVSGATVGLYDADDLVTPLTTTTTGADGTWTITRNFSPGKFFIKVTDSVNSVTRWMSSRDTVMQGPNSSYDINYVLASLGDGVCDNVANEFVTTASSLNSTIQTGAALVKGIIASTTSNTVVAHDAHHATLARKDRIVLEVTRLGETDEGKSEAKIVAGTAAASPALPALTQTSALWQYELYEVDVPATSGALTLTDRRTFVGQTPIAVVPPTVTAYTDTADVTSFNTSSVLTSIYSSSHPTNNDLADGFFEAYLLLTVTSGTLTVAAYRDVVANAGTNITTNGVTGVQVLPVRIDFTAQAPAGARTFGVAAFSTAGAVITVHGYTAFLTQFRRV